MTEQTLPNSSSPAPAANQKPQTYYGYNYAPAAKPPKEPIVFGGSEIFLAVSMLVLGFIFWEWGIIFGASSALGGFLFFMLAVIVCLIYFKSKGIRQNPRSLTALAVVILGALPFVLYDGILIYVFLLFFEFIACLFWIMYTSGTSVSRTLSGFVLSDWVNQNFIIPFGNFGRLFGVLRAASKNRKNSKSLLMGVIGVAISIPVVAIILSLLISADSNFAAIMSDFAEAVNLARIGGWIFEFAVGIPVACYIFGSVFGNTYRRSTEHITKEGSAHTLKGAHKLPPASVYAPVVVLEVIYVIFFAVMSVYLFSAFGGRLPETFSYAEYARKGFFELCGVSAINLCVLIFAYLFAKRSEGEYPKPLRVLTAILSVMTALLITTALSKMFLYVGAYGLSRLRLYTIWFMVLLLLVFITLIVWHVRPFNAGRPIVVAAVVLILALFLANTDGLIAKYNTEQYFNGHLKTVDTEMMGYMSDAALPYLNELKTAAPDPKVRAEAADAIRVHEENTPMLEGDRTSFYDWNLQTAFFT
jgi:hypothetical protein